MGGRIFLEADKGLQNPAGLYGGRSQNGKYEIWLNRKQLLEPESLVATLAHEMAKKNHIVFLFYVLMLISLWILYSGRPDFKSN
ncbi:hypothetical protein [Chitinophaga sp. CF118]|uniref:hypothetical protein n=1 Tax=Chitinophaga sp. CF118 TaxID=1884367 RepID=UPI0011602A4E|nr:hypothetical protein [Chitinophaga sp. CF118]